MSAPRVKLDIDASREKLASLGCGYAAEALEGQRNAQLKAKYNQLIEAGKPPKLALNAIMRRLIVLANALIRDRRQWSEIRL